MAGISVAVGAGAQRPIEDWMGDVQAALAQAASAQAAAAAAQATANSALAAIPPEQTKRPETWYAVGNGVADDTWAVQQALNAMGEGGACELRPGAIYSVNNLVLPTFSGSWNKLGLFCRGGTATIRARASASANPDYLVASSRWVTGQPWTQYSAQPYQIHRVVFDAAGLRSYPLVLKTYGSECVGVQCVGGTAIGALVTRRNQDGSLGTTAYLSDNSFELCDFRNNTMCGFAAQGPVENNGLAVTDITIRACVASGGQTGFWLPNCGGLTFDNSKAFSLSVAAARFENLSRGHNIDTNIFDGAPVMIGGTGPFYSYGAIGGGNSYYVPLVVEFADNDIPETFFVEDERFYRGAGNPGTKAWIECRNNRAVKKIVPHGCKFETSTPLRFGAGVSDLGQFDRARDNYSIDAGGWL